MLRKILIFVGLSVAQAAIKEGWNWYFTNNGLRNPKNYSRLDRRSSGPNTGSYGFQSGTGDPRFRSQSGHKLTIQDAFEEESY